MKTTTNLKENKSRKVLKGLVFGFGLLFSVGASAKSKLHNVNLLKSLNPYTKVSGRTPSNFVPNDEVEATLEKNKGLWIDRVMVEDDRGVLKKIKKDMNTWNDKEEYAKQWNLESTGLYKTPTNERKVKYLQKNLLKYLDKRISGEVKRAEKGSTLHSVGQAQKALKPQTKVQLGSRTKLRIKAKVLQGKAFVIVNNPYVKHETTVRVNGKVKMNFKRELKDLGMEANIDYRVKDGEWTAYVDKGITKNVIARVSSEQNDKTMAFTKNTNRTVELMYSHRF